MLSFMRWLLPVTAAAGLFMGLSVLPGRAADAPADTQKGTVTGTVVDKDGKGVANAEVALTKPPPKGTKAANNAKPQNLADDGTKAKGDKKKQEPLFHTNTDADGKFTIKDVPIGEYLAIARVEG